MIEIQSNQKKKKKNADDQGLNNFLTCRHSVKKKIWISFFFYFAFNHHHHHHNSRWQIDDVDYLKVLCSIDPFSIVFVYYLDTGWLSEVKWLNDLVLFFLFFIHKEITFFFQLNKMAQHHLFFCILNAWWWCKTICFFLSIRNQSLNATMLRMMLKKKFFIFFSFLNIINLALKCVYKINYYTIKNQCGAIINNM